MLGIFDTDSVAEAGDVIRAVEEGIGAGVSEVVPYDWDGHRRGLRAVRHRPASSGLDDLPAEDPDALDAVSFPVPARVDGEDGDPLGEHPLRAAPADARQRPAAARTA